MNKLKIGIITGVIASVIVLVLYGTGFFRTPELMLAQRLGFGEPPAYHAFGLQAVLIAIFSILAAWITLDVRGGFRKFILLFLSVLLLASFAIVLGMYQVFFSPFQSIVAVLAGFVAAQLYLRTPGGGRRLALENLFAGRLSRAHYRKLAAKYSGPGLPAVSGQGTVLVVGITNQAELMETLAPDQVMAVTNRFLESVTHFLVDVGGYFDSMSGESVQVLFGAPVSDENHALAACRAAVNLKNRLDDLNREIDAQYHRRLRFAMGIDSGEMVSGVLHDGETSRFSVVGPAAEFAHQLFAACPIYGSQVLIGPETHQLVDEDFDSRPIELLRSPARQRRVEIHEILAAKNALGPEHETSREHFWRAVIHFRERNWERAAEEFKKARINGIPDPAIDFYLLRLERIRRGEEEAEQRQVLLFNS